jgi:hypothetical protein
MITGQAPFAGATMAEIINSVLEKQPPSLVRLVPDLPLELEKIVFTALAKKREDRYQQADEMQRELQHVSRHLEYGAGSSKRAPNQKYDTQLEQPIQRIANPRASAPLSQNPKVWLLGATIGLILITGGFLAYSSFLLPQSNPDQRSLTTILPAPVELMTYYLETITPAGTRSVANGTSPLAANLDIKFHFTPRRHGFLYLIAPDEKNALRTFLTAQPMPQSGVTTNEVLADVEYVFPDGNENWIGLTDMPTTTFIVIFSSSPVINPGFLNTPAGHQLTPSELLEWEKFRSQFFVKVPEGTTGTPAVTVTAPGDRAAGQPIIFDITIKMTDTTPRT